MNPTIKSVAEKANVSIATVSRVINGVPYGYSEKTKQRVLQAIKDLNYQPNAVARGLVNKKTHTIGVLVPDVSSMFASEVLNGVEDVANSLEHSVIVCNTDANGVRTLKYLKVLNEKRVDGIVFVSEVMTEEYYTVIKSMNVPTVLVSSFSHKFQLPYVRVDDRHAAYKATEYLIAKGHRKVGMISGPPEDPIAGMERIKGYKQALVDSNIPENPNWLMPGDSFGHITGIYAIEKLMKQAPELTAVFAASDELAVGILLWAYEHGVKIPEELSVIGYDNIKIAEMVTPPLTTVCQPLYDMGTMASKMLFDLVDGHPVESRIMPFTILERDTVKDLT